MYVILPYIYKQTYYTGVCYTTVYIYKQTYYTGVCYTTWNLSNLITPIYPRMVKFCSYYEFLLKATTTLSREI